MEHNLWIHWAMTGNEILNKTKYFIDKSIKNNKKLLVINIKNNKNIKEFMAQLADDITEYTTIHSMCRFLQYVSPDLDIRKNCYISDLLLTKYINELNLREDIYCKIKAFYKKYNNVLKSADNLFIDTIIKGYERNGINLSKKNKEKLLKVKQEISKIEKAIGKFINNNKDVIVKLTKDQTDGLNYIKNGKIILNKCNYLNCMRYINDESVRKQLELDYSAKYSYIINDISRLIVLRDKHAKLLSYNNHSDYKASMNMAKNSSDIKDFLTELLYKLDNRYFREIETLLKLKKYDNNVINKNKINSWDLQYYINKWKKEYGLNEQYVCEYFPVSHVIKSTFEIYEQLFSIKFIKISNRSLWHNDVLLYKVIENDNNLGYFYLDLYSRDNKYSQTRCFTLQPACMFPIKSNEYKLSIIALVTSFNIKNNKDGIILLNHNDTISFFHEFGHILHNLFGKTKYCIFSGTNVETDFVETPALVLDYLCWDKTILKKLSCHYKTKKSLADNIIDKMIKIRDIDIGIHYKKHILISIYDQLIHSSDNFVKLCSEHLKGTNNRERNLMITFKSLYKQLHENILCVVTNKIPNYNIGYNDGILFPGLWINYICGGDAQYYGYIWSKIYAADLFNEIGDDRKLFRDTLINGIFKYGGTSRAMDMLVNILNRKPNVDGFFKMHKLELTDEFSFFFSSEYFNNNNNNNVYLTEDDDQTNYDDLYVNRFSEIDLDNISEKMDK